MRAFHFFFFKCWYMIKLIPAPGFRFLWISIKINLRKLRQFSAMGKSKVAK